MNRQLSLAIAAIAAIALLPAFAAPLQAGQPVSKPPPKSVRAKPPAAKPTESEEDLRRMEATPAERREELRAVARTAADRIDVRIRALQQRLDDSTQRMTTESRDAAEASLKSVRAERARFATQVARLDERSSAAVGEAKTRLIAAYRDLSKAMERAWARIQPPAKAPAAPSNEKKGAKQDDDGSDADR